MSLEPKTSQVSRARCRVSGIGQAAASVALVLLCLSSAYGQETQSPERAHAEVCPDPPPQSSGSHRFRQQGETFEIPISVADCQPIAFMLRWSNGRNNGSNLIVTFVDNNGQPIYSRAVSGFQTGILHFPFATLDPQPWFAAGSIVSVPTTIVIQAVRPFYAPANFSYTVTRKAARVQAKARAEAQPSARPLSARLDDQVAMKLRTAAGRLLSQSQSSSGRSASGSGESITYRLEEVALPEPRELEINGRKENVGVAYRLTLTGGEPGPQRGSPDVLRSISKFGLIWVDDAALPVFSSGPQEIGTLIYDRSVLRDGAEISVSNADGSQMYSLGERLKYQSNVQSPTSNVKTKESEEGTQVVGIRSAVRVIGATRISLVQIELKTNRPFPPKDSALQLQIGKRFFLNELTGDHTGRTLTLTLPQEIFADLKQGAEIVAFFNKPDRSGFAGKDVWHFGRLDKGK
jgi:hypothetical protein